MRQGYLAYRCARIMTLASVVGTVFCSSVLAQVTKRPSVWLRDIAKVTLNSSGRSQITYNPAICRRLGPELCEYFHAHEMGHVNLRHLERGVPIRRAEAEADRYAAAHASPAAVAAAKRYFANGNGASFMHGSGRQRAARLSQPLKIVKSSSRQRPSNKQRSSKVRVVERRSAAPRQYSGVSKTNASRRVIVRAAPQVKYEKRVSSYVKNGVRYQRVTLAKR